MNQSQLSKFVSCGIFALIAVVLGMLFIKANAQTPAQITDIGRPYISFTINNSGLLGAIIALGCAVGMLFLPRYRWALASIALVAITFVTLSGLWTPGLLGISDWDYYFTYHDAMTKVVTAFHQFPLWNPYICGGTSAIGDPEFPVFSPLFWFELLFGTQLGLRIAIFTSVSVFALGILFLAKKFKLSPLSGFIAAITASFSTVSLLEIVEGHPNVLSAMWLPWIFLAWYHTYTKLNNQEGKRSQFNFEFFRNSFICSLFLALTFFQGGIYLLMYTAIVFIFFIAVSKRRLNAIAVTAVAGVFALGLAAMKLLPVFFWLAQFQDQVYASSPDTLPYLHKILFGRYLHGSENVFPTQTGGWHEYGAYISPLAIFLALIGAWFNRKSRLIRSLFIGALLALIISATGPFLKPFFDQASFLPRSNVTRFILLSIIPISLLAGFGTEKISKNEYRLIPLLALVIISIDMLPLASALSSQAFVLPPVMPLPSPASSPIAYTLDKNEVRVNGVDFTRAYGSYLAGYGTMSYCSVLGPEPAVMTVQHKEEDKSFLLLNNSTGKVSLISWTPNKIIAEVTTNKDNFLVINQNYAKGWFADGKPARDIKSRLAFPVKAGTQRLTLSYFPQGLREGIVISLVSFVALLLVLIISFRRSIRLNNKVS